MSKSNTISAEELQELSLKEIEFPQILNIISKFAISELGKNIVNNIEPFLDIKLLREELAQIEELRHLLLKNEDLPFGNISDIYSLLYKSRIDNAVLAPVEIYKIFELAKTSRNIKSFIYNRNEDLPLIYQNTDLLIDNKILEKHISESVDETGNVKDSASRELSKIRKEIIEKSAYLRNRLNKLVKKFSDEDYTREDLITIRDGRFVIPIKVENKRTIGGIIHGASQTGATVFVEPAEVFELNNELSLLENEEKREIYRILQQLTSEVKQNVPDLIKSLDILSFLDAKNAKARFSIELEGIMPKITEENYLFLKDIRHPILTFSKGKKKVIPLSLELNSDKRGILISGPNAGGKTVALKTVGLNIAMALSGIFPLGECTTNIKTIFSAIGDNQSIQNDLSTFSAQILRLKYIVQNSFADSLILVDEIGSGTDPVEGSAIASGILETFSELKAFFLCSTHQSSLKTYALNRSEIVNASLEFDEQQLKPTYKFLVGIPGNSYAFSLARNIGISELILQRAQKHIDTKQQQLEKGIKLLQKYQRKSIRILQKAKEDKQKADKLVSDYEEKLNDLKKRKAELMVKAREEASKILENSNALIERTIKEIREEKKQIGELKKEFENEKKALTTTTKEEKKVIQTEMKTIDSKTKTEKNKNDSIQKLQVGSFIKYTENKSTGKILELDESKKLALVEINGIKFKIKTNLLESATQED